MFASAPSPPPHQFPSLSLCDSTAKRSLGRSTDHFRVSCDRYAACTTYFFGAMHWLVLIMCIRRRRSARDREVCRGPVYVHQTGDSRSVHQMGDSRLSACRPMTAELRPIAPATASHPSPVYACMQAGLHARKDLHYSLRLRISPCSE